MLVTTVPGTIPIRTKPSHLSVLNLRKSTNLTIRQWMQLSNERQCKSCQSLNPYEDWPLFKSIERKFLLKYGRQQPAVKKAFCGMGSGLGPYNVITVSLKKGRKRVKLPAFFMGFPVEKVYESGKRSLVKEAKKG